MSNNKFSITRQVIARGPERALDESKRHQSNTKRYRGSKIHS